MADVSPIITLLTDFGTADHYVAAMKGVLNTWAPDVTVVDAGHQVPPQDVGAAAWALGQYWRYYPPRSIHVAVVDPGVGGNRRPLALNARSQFYVGPDNGVFTSVMESKTRCYELPRKKYFLKSISATFHGRDIFAPVAAWIARGTPLTSLGRKILDPTLLDIPRPRFFDGSLSGEVVYQDRFGNLTTNISASLLHQHFGKNPKLVIKIGGKRILGLTDHYSQIELDELGAIINSWDALEIFCREDDAAQRLNKGLGDRIFVIKHP